MHSTTRDFLPPLMEKWVVASPLHTHVDQWINRFKEQDYSQRTIQAYASYIAHFLYWTHRRRIEVSGIDERLIGHFIDRHLPACHCAPRCPQRGRAIPIALEHFLATLRDNGVIPPRAETMSVHILDELRKFDRYLVEVRGFSEMTRHGYQKFVRPFLMESFRNNPVTIQALRPKDVARFVPRFTRGWKPASIKKVTTSLRAYFYYRASLGTEITNLAAALPRISLWRCAQLPKMLTSEEIRRLLSAFDRSTSQGKRDFAIACCLIDLGLRSTEVARLRLDDVDWREGVLRVPSKGQRIDVLPLPKRTGRAIVDYLQHGRPASARRELFVRYVAPHNVPPTTELIRHAIVAAAARCGLKDRIGGGTHILRHTVAGQLVERGIPLKEIADLLRHRDLDTTTIYAKVDLPSLTRVALPWPGSSL